MAGRRKPGQGYPVTPDGRYFVVRGRLWRRSNPALPEEERSALVRALMDARRDIARAQRGGDPDAVQDARRRVQAAKEGWASAGPCGGPTARLITTGTWRATHPTATGTRRSLQRRMPRKPAGLTRSVL